MSFPNHRLHTRPAERMRARCVFAESFISRNSMAENGNTAIAAADYLEVSRGARNGTIPNIFSFTSKLGISKTAGKGTLFVKITGCTRAISYTGITTKPGGIKIPLILDAGQVYYGPGFKLLGSVEYIDGEDHFFMVTFDSTAGEAKIYVDDGIYESVSATSPTETANDIAFGTYTTVDCQRILVFNDVLTADDFAVLRTDNWTDFVKDDLYVMWRMNEFGNVQSRYRIRSTDLINSLTKSAQGLVTRMPTFNTFGRDSFYHFDGVDDFLSGFPDMPDAFTTSLCVSDETGDGRFPSTVTEDTDTTILDGMKALGGFAYDNIHNLYIADRELKTLEKLHLSHLQTFDTNWGVISGALRNLINEGVCRVCLQFENPTVLNEVVSKGVRSFTVSGASFDSTTRTFSFASTTDRLELQNVSADLDMREVTLIVFGILTGAVGGAGLIHKGTDLQFTVNNDALYFGGTSFASETGLGDGSEMYAVVCHSGYVPRFFRDGRFIGEGGSAVTIPESNTSSWTFGNNAANSANLSGCDVRAFIVFDTCLTDREITDVYHSLRGDHDLAGAAS